MSRESESLLSAYLKHRPDLLRHFAARLRSDAAAEDLVQEIYVRLRSRGEPTRVENAAAYLFRMGANLMVDRLRTEARSAARDAAWRDASSAFHGDEPVADEPAADEALASRQRLQAVVAALEALPEQTQRIFRMHKFEGRGYGEVAQRLGVSKSSVEKHMMAALRHLAGSLRGGER